MPIIALSASAALTLLAGCSDVSAIAPKSIIPQGVAHLLMGRAPFAVNPVGLLKLNLNNTARHIKSFYSCPASGTIEYISDYINSNISVYAGDFASQAPCGVLTNGLLNPQGLFVNKNGDLYVANTGAFNVLVFQRGKTTATNAYRDPSGQYPVDVTVAKDGTVIASNIFNNTFTKAGSISTWIAGPSGGTFVGNFLMVNDAEGLYVTVQSNGTLYYNDVDLTTGGGVVYTGRCPAGACSAFSLTGANSSFPGGLRSADHEDLVQDDQGGRVLTTYERLPNGMSCNLGSDFDPVSMDINKDQTHVFIADAGDNMGVEVNYSHAAAGCTLIGTVAPAAAGGALIGAGVDAPESVVRPFSVTRS